MRLVVISLRILILVLNLIILLARHLIVMSLLTHVVLRRELLRLRNLALA